MKPTQTSNLTLHMVASLDGFISKQDGTVDWMHSQDQYDKGVALTEEDIADYLASIDCYVMGSHTYELALQLGWPYGDKPVVVVSSRSLSSDRASVSFFHGDIVELVEEQLKARYQNIWLVGGAALAKAFLQSNLVDKITLSIMPIILGGGTLFFDFIGKEIPLHLEDVKAYQDGMVELSYAVK